MPQGGPMRTVRLYLRRNHHAAKAPAAMITMIEMVITMMGQRLSF